jgi:hypothetical protein
VIRVADSMDSLKATTVAVLRIRQSTLDWSVVGLTKNGVQVADHQHQHSERIRLNRHSLSLHVPRKVEKSRDTERRPNATVPEEIKWHKRVPSARLPHHECRDAAEANDEHGDNVPCAPLVLGRTSDGEGDEDERKHRDEENDSGDVELPEKLAREPGKAQTLVRGPMLIKGACLRRASCAEE